jgi:hypothetical protein
LMAGGPEDHFIDSRELYVLVEGDEWARVEALDPDAGYWARRFAQPSVGACIPRQAARGGREPATAPFACLHKSTSRRADCWYPCIARTTACRSRGTRAAHFRFRVKGTVQCLRIPRTPLAGLSSSPGRRPCRSRAGARAIGASAASDEVCGQATATARQRPDPKPARPGSRPRSPLPASGCGPRGRPWPPAPPPSRPPCLVSRTRSRPRVPSSCQAEP